MVGFRWHIVTSVLLLCPLSGSFSQTAGSLGVTPTLQADTTEFRHHKTLDSLQASTAHAYDSLTNAYNSVVGIAENASQRVRNRADSLTEIGLPATRFTGRLDSIERWKHARLDSIAGRIAAVRSGARKKINDLDLPPELRARADDLVSRIQEPGMSLSDGEISHINDRVPSALPLADLGGHNVDDINLPALDNPVANETLSEIPDTDLPNGSIDGFPPLSSIQKEVAGAIPDAGNPVCPGPRLRGAKHAVRVLGRMSFAKHQLVP